MMKDPFSLFPPSVRSLFLSLLLRPFLGFPFSLLLSVIRNWWRVGVSTFGE